MSKEKQKPAFASGLYIAFAVCILAVVCIGAFSALNQLFAADGVPQPDPIIPEDTAPSEVEKPKVPDAQLDPVPDLVPNEDTAKQESTEPIDALPEPTPEPSPRVYSFPTGGEIAKEYVVDALVYSVTMNDYRAHTGVDVVADVGSMVCAFTDGVVESIHADPLMGQTVILDHSDGLKTIYQNLSQTLPEGLAVGVTVSAGQMIGAVGDTALIECSDVSHLHFEVQKDGAPTDPTQYLSLCA